MKASEVVENFENGFKASSGNYFTDGKILCLFGNRIAEKRNEGIFFTLAGYDTNTTKKALNWLNGVSIRSRQGVIKCHDKIIESDQWYNVRDFLN